jgi:hypothetical protein
MKGIYVQLLNNGKESLTFTSLRLRNWFKRAICVCQFTLWSMVIMWIPASAQTCPSQKLQTRIAEIERDLLSDLGPVRLHRLEELEDALVAPSGSSVESPFQIYQIEQRRFFLKDGKILQQVPWGRRFSRYFAISQGGERVYDLTSLVPKEGENFKDLVAYYHLSIPQTPTDAESRALFCARVVFGAEPGQWVLGEEQAKQAVANHFSSHPSEADRWWRAFRSKHPRTSLNVTTVNAAAAGSYLTRVPLLWAPVETGTAPEIRELQIQVNQDGSCQRAAESASH